MLNEKAIELLEKGLEPVPPPKGNSRAEHITWLSQSLKKREIAMSKVAALIRQQQPPAGEFTKELMNYINAVDFLRPEWIREKMLEACSIIDAAEPFEEAIKKMHNGYRPNTDHPEPETPAKALAELLSEAEVLGCSKREEQLEAEKKECRQILEKQLDRDKDPKDSLRDLVVVACNALHWARAKKKHFVMADLEAELAEARKEKKRLKEASKAMKSRLGKRSDHNRDCRRYKYGDNYECTCGYDD